MYASLTLGALTGGLGFRWRLQRTVWGLVGGYNLGFGVFLYILLA